MGSSPYLLFVSGGERDRILVREISPRLSSDIGPIIRRVQKIDKTVAFDRTGTTRLPACPGVMM
jgi:hypothetical protein